MSETSPHSATPGDGCDKLLDHLYGELRGAEAEAFQRHLEGCERCRRDLESFQRTRGAARASMRVVEPPASAMGALNAQLLHAAAQRGKRAPGGKVLPFVRKIVMAPAFMAAAGFVVVGGVVGTMWLRGHVLMPPPVSEEAPVASAPAEAAEKIVQPAGAAPAAQPAAPPAEAEAATDKSAKVVATKPVGGHATAARPEARADGKGGAPDSFGSLLGGERAKKESASDLPAKHDAKLRLEVGDHKLLDVEAAPATREPLGYTNTTPTPKAPAPSKDRRGGDSLDGLLNEAATGAANGGGYRSGAGTPGKNAPAPSSLAKSGRARADRDDQAGAPSTRPQAAQGPGQWNGDVGGLGQGSQKVAPAAPTQTAAPRPNAAAPAQAPPPPMAEPKSAEGSLARSADSLRKQAEELAATGRCDDAKRLYDQLEQGYPAYKVPVKDRVTLLHCFSQAGQTQRAVDELDSLRRDRAPSRVIQSEEQALKQQRQAEPPPQAQRAAPAKKAKAKPAAEVPADKAADKAAY